MDEITNNQQSIGDVDATNTEITFYNLTILKEFSNIANLIRDEDFLETVPKAKLGRVKWVPMFSFLKQTILDEMVQELSTMWKEEGMNEKLEILAKQKEKYSERNDETLWRPKLGDVNSQLKAHDVAILQKQKVFLESHAKEYECRVARLKKIISAKRGYLKAFNLDIQQYQKKNEEILGNINKKFENHKNLTRLIVPCKMNVDDIQWCDKDLDDYTVIDKAVNKDIE